MKILVIGAAGFVGRALTARIVREPLGVESLTLVDRIDFPTPPAAFPVIRRCGDFADPDFCRSIVSGIDTVILLAAVLGGAAEADYSLARRVNVDATLSLFELLRDVDKPPRVLFASTVGIFGHPLPARVDDATIPRPHMVYGAQKLMMEEALSHFSRRGWLDGIALRLPGIMARPGADRNLKSAFLNNLFYAVRDHRSMVLPVPPGGTTWLTSVRTTADNLFRAARLSSSAMHATRAFNLPSLCPSVESLVAALFDRYPQSRAQIGYAPDPEITAQFACYPPLIARVASELGFAADLSMRDLVLNSMPLEDDAL